LRKRPLLPSRSRLPFRHTPVDALFARLQLRPRWKI